MCKKLKKIIAEILRICLNLTKLNTELTMRQPVIFLRLFKSTERRLEKPKENLVLTAENKSTNKKRFLPIGRNDSIEKKLNKI